MSWVSEQLRCLERKHKDDRVSTFGLRISDMAHDAAVNIEELEAANKSLRAELEAAKSDMDDLANREADPCDYCGSMNNCMHPAFCPSRGYRNFVWRGVPTTTDHAQGVEGGEEV